MPHPISSLEPRYADADSRGVRSLDPETLEWPITDLGELIEHVEKNGSGLWAMEAEMDRPETLPDALCRGWITRKEGYKIDLARTIPAPHSPRSTIIEIASASPAIVELPRFISLYIMAQNIEHCPPECAISTGIFVGIAPLRPNAGHRYAETSYHWTYTTTCDFSMENEFCAVELPLLSALAAEKDGIRGDDGFTLCIWVGPKWDSRPSFTVPDSVRSSTIRGLERLVDRDTGDVKFICLEHIVHPASERSNAVGETTPGEGLLAASDGKGLPEVSLSSETLTSHRTDADQTVAPPARPKITSRKRVIYAHADILEEKSDYFRDLLTSGFSESGRYNTITVEDGDHNTLYWVIRYLYTNSITFASHTPVRSTVLLQQLSPEEKKKLLASTAPFSGPHEWNFHVMPLEGEEEDSPDREETTGTMRTIPNSSIPSGNVRGVEGSGKSSLPIDGTIHTRSRSAASSTTTAGRSSTYSTSSTARRVPVGAHPKFTRPSSSISSTTTSAMPGGRTGDDAGRGGLIIVNTSTPRHKPFISPRKMITPPSTAQINSSNLPTASPPSPVSNTSGFKTKVQHCPSTSSSDAGTFPSSSPPQASADPHPHPTPCLPDANALEVYFLANRYRLEALKDMAQEHLLGNITVEDCMPMA
ncbi:hypothetical protein I316_03168 [Kwoniella heveanensis BCC8398]|uniref:BTB domain-containing protein n=1 Tax=Kwoniella heveanensis BCC8398 TaxID=1296120 RepID=A0A1B9GVQ6_9TREE|nr:hypothetical protein I316_03168 [Kwoniella heveanensis BCC8398]